MPAAGDCLGPLTDACFLTKVNLLPLADQANYYAPIWKPVADPYEVRRL